MISYDPAVSSLSLSLLLVNLSFIRLELGLIRGVTEVGGDGRDRARPLTVRGGGLEVRLTGQTPHLRLRLRQPAVRVVGVETVERSHHGQRSPAPSSSDTVVHAGLSSPATIRSYHHQLSWRENCEAAENLRALSVIT